MLVFLFYFKDPDEVLGIFLIICESKLQFVHVEIILVTLDPTMFQTTPDQSEIYFQKIPDGDSVSLPSVVHFNPSRHHLSGGLCNNLHLAPVPYTLYSQQNSQRDIIKQSQLCDFSAPTPQSFYLSFRMIFKIQPPLSPSSLMTSLTLSIMVTLIYSTPDQRL